MALSWRVSCRSVLERPSGKRNLVGSFQAILAAQYKCLSIIFIALLPCLLARKAPSDGRFSQFYIQTEFERHY